MTSDPLRTDPSGSPDAASGVDRDAKIEQLLLAGLDHYFASQYEQAINIWTRALFFDRNHARARAYIERARRAQAERQRESEELLHNGAVAYRRGDGREARRLLQAALDAGAPFEDAFPMLERLNQLEVAPAPLPLTPRTRVIAQTAAGDVAGNGRTRWPIYIALGSALVGLIGIGVYATISSRVDWRGWPFATDPVSPSSGPAVRNTMLAIPTRGELALASARSLVSSDPRAAMSALERVRSTDPQKGEADRLRSDIQRRLIRGAAETPGASPAGDSGSRRRP